MGERVDRRGILDEDVFAYRVSKDGKVFISWNGRQVSVLSGDKARRFLSDMQGKQGKDAQLLMAKITGNFKRGNEKDAKRP